MDHVSSAPLSTDHQSSPDCDICRQVSVPDAVMSAEASTASTHPATNGHCHHSSTGEAAYLIDTKDEDDDNSSGSSELRKSSSLDDWWWWELIASLASFALMATIVIMLINYDGNLAPKLPWAITLNTIVSLLATLSKASMLLAVTAAIGQSKWVWYSHEVSQSTRKQLQHAQIFDDASRGPLGALTMLIVLRHKTLASIGAMLMLLSLLFEPFAQQTITVGLRFPYKAMPESGIGRVVYYSALDGGGSTNLYLLPLTMDEAISSSIFESQAASYLDPLCPSGNCTWPIFASLGFCSQCSDTTQYVQANSQCTEQQDSTTNCTFSFPSTYKLIMSNMTENLAFVSKAWGDNVTGYDYDILPMTSTAHGTFAGIKDPMFAFSSLRFGSDYDVIAAASECAFYVCVKSYNISVLNGQTSEEVVSTFYSSQSLTIWDGRNGASAYDNFTMRPPSHTGTSNDGVEYSITYITIQSISMTLTQYFTGYVTVDTSNYERGWGSSDAIQHIYLSDKVSEVIDNVARSMSAFIQNNNADSTVTGFQSHVDTYIEVRWLWLILPITTIFLASLFLALTMYVSSRHAKNLWKSSILPVIFHGLHDTQTRPEIRTEKQLSGMQRVAKDIKVSFRPTHDDTVGRFVE